MIPIILQRVSFDYRDCNSAATPGVFKLRHFGRWPQKAVFYFYSSARKCLRTKLSTKNYRIWNCQHFVTAKKHEPKKTWLMTPPTFKDHSSLGLVFYETWMNLGKWAPRLRQEFQSPPAWHTEEDCWWVLVGIFRTFGNKIHCCTFLFWSIPSICHCKTLQIQVPKNHSIH